MTIEELIDKLKKYDKTDDVVLLDHRCIEAFPTELSVVRRTTKREREEGFFDNPVVLD